MEPKARAARLEFESRYPPPSLRLDTPRFDGVYFGPARPRSIRFYPDGTADVGGDEGRWIAADGHVEIEAGFLRVGGPIGREKLFITYAATNALGDAVDAGYGEFEFEFRGG